jgi:quercetin dioxygenase-like cupin family protein
MRNHSDVGTLPMTLEIVQTARLEAFRGLPERVAIHDLGLHEATAGVFTARRVKTGKRWSISEIASNPDALFTFIYVLDGRVTMRLSDRLVTLQKHDAISQAPFSISSLVEVSLEFEFIEFQALDNSRARKYLPSVPQQTVSLDAPEAHVVGTGPRDFFDYRNLGVADATDRQIEVQVVRAQKAREGGTGWHSHNMAQLSYGLAGWAMLDVEGVSFPVRQEAGDALCIPPGCAHNAGSFSDDYWALQLQIPADYDTIQQDVPIGQ